MVDQEPVTHTHKRFPVSLSSAVVITHHGDIILVRDKEGRWGLPAGGVEPEGIEVSTRREVGEETGLKDYGIDYHGRPDIVVVTGDDKHRVGIIYNGYVFDVPSPNGWEVQGDPDITFAKPFEPNAVIQLLNSNDIRYPYFNRPQIQKHLLRRLKDVVRLDCEEYKLSDPNLTEAFNWVMDKFRNNEITGLGYHRDPVFNLPSLYFQPWSGEILSGNPLMILWEITEADVIIHNQSFKDHLK